MSFVNNTECMCLTAVSMVGLKPSDVPPPLAVKVLSAGSAACIADLVTFPLDTAKVRLQVQNECPRRASVAAAFLFAPIFL